VPLRHRTAIRRVGLSRPIQLTLQLGLATRDETFFDYGCGRGDDVRLLRTMGYQADGWDPAHAPNSERRLADVVNLGYVVNVIEKPAERDATLRDAWGLCRKLLVVAARLVHEADGANLRAFGDGYLTERDTFQRFYAQDELRTWIEGTLGVQAAPAAPGVFLVFRDEALRQRFLQSRYRHRVTAPRILRRDVLFQEHKSLLDPLLAFYEQHGRLPEERELPGADGLATSLGGIRRAFTLVRRVTGDERWEKAKAACAEDLLVYLALARFDRRPAFHALGQEVQLDVRAHFGSDRAACEAADAQLFSVGRLETVDAACQAAPFGLRTDEALYVHVCGIPELPLILRLYEGCARGYVGEIEGATIVKMHRRKPQISYLYCPDFEKAAHPAVRGGFVVRLQTFEVRERDYSADPDPFILLRKEAFLPPAHPLRPRFERLTQQEERAGLLEDGNNIRPRITWTQALNAKGFAVRGHRLVRAGRSGLAV